MSAHVLLNLLNKLRRRDKMQDSAEHLHGWKFKILKILNFRYSNLKTCCMPISSLNGWLPKDELKINQRSY